MLRALWFLSVLSSYGGVAWSVPAIPAPDVVFYGLVTNGGAAVAPTGVVWAVSGNSEAVTFSNSTVVVINGSAFYISRVKFEQRVLGGTGLTPTAGYLSLTDSATSYARTATVDGQAAALPPGKGSFSMGAGLLGLVERIDLVVGGEETFEQWSQRIFGRLVDPNGDEDGDGDTNYEEYVAGTDPKDPRSRFSVRGFRPLPGGGFEMRWEGVSNRTYLVERSFSLISNSWVTVMGPTNSQGGEILFSDTSLTNVVRAFYRILVVE